MQLERLLREEHTIAASKFTRRSSSEKSAFPKGKCTIPVLSALYSTFPCLNSAIACKGEFISFLINQVFTYVKQRFSNLSFVTEKGKNQKENVILELCKQVYNLYIEQ